MTRTTPLSHPLVTAAVLGATVAQLAVGAFVPGLEQFAGKAFGARLVAYPLMMLLVPAVWWARNRHTGARTPWGAFSLVMAPFLIDVTGNTLDLYDAVVWWDDANHFVNWLLLLWGLGLLVARRIEPAWATVLLITGLGAVLAIGWELGEWYTFIRHGTELDTAYTDTLGDEALGTLGALVAGVLVRRAGPDRPGSTATITDWVCHDQRMRSIHVSEVIHRPAHEVYAMASDPDRLPDWASGLAQGEVTRDGDVLVVTSPMGRVKVALVAPNDLGVIDHDVTLPPGEVVTNPVRVLAHPEGSEVLFTVRQLAMTDEELERDAATVRGDLRRLRALVEGTPDGAR